MFGSVSHTIREDVHKLKFIPSEATKTLGVVVVGEGVLKVFIHKYSPRGVKSQGE